MGTVWNKDFNLHVSTKISLLFESLVSFDIYIISVKGSLTPFKMVTLCCECSQSLHRNSKKLAFLLELLWLFCSVLAKSHNSIFKSLLEWSCQHQQLSKWFVIVASVHTHFGCLLCMEMCGGGAIESTSHWYLLLLSNALWGIKNS